MTDRLPGFEEIYDQFRGKIYAYLSRMVGAGDAEDLTQEVFFKVSQSLPAFRGESSLSTWIYKIATNAALDKLRGRSVRLVSSADVLIDPDSITSIVKDTPALPANSRPSTEQQAIRGETNACIRNVIDRLPETYKVPILLGDIEGLKDKELAAVLGISLKAAKIRLHRARERLRKELSSYCIFYRDEQNEFTCDVRHDSRERPARGHARIPGNKKKETPENGSQK